MSDELLPDEPAPMSETPNSKLVLEINGLCIPQISQKNNYLIL
jgi:hypothetical protein